MFTSVNFLRLTLARPLSKIYVVNASSFKNLQNPVGMSFRIAGARLVTRAIKQVETPLVELPLFLCPALLGATRSQSSPFPFQRRKLHTTPSQAIISESNPSQTPDQAKRLGARLPLQCAGCGALSQTVDNDEPGFYNLKRKTVKEYIAGTSGKSADLEIQDEDRIIQQSLENASSTVDPKLLKQLAFTLPTKISASKSNPFRTY